MPNEHAPIGAEEIAELAKATQLYIEECYDGRVAVSWHYLTKVRSALLAERGLAAGDPSPGAGRRIIEGIKEAIAGKFAAVTIDGQRWVRASPALKQKDEV